MKVIIKALLVLFSLLVVVVPNSFQTLSIALFVMLYLCIHFYTAQLYDVYLILFWFIISMLFLGFILISPIALYFKAELIFKYIVSPLFWISIFSYIRKYYSINLIIVWLIKLSFLGSLSVLILYVIMSLGYVDFIKYFIKSPNIDSNSGFGFTLHVYGSLAFFSLAMMPSMFYIKSNVLKVLYIFILVLAAILSGRTALLLTVALGLGLFVFYLSRFSFDYRKLLIVGATSVVLSLLAYEQYLENFDVSIIEVFRNDHIDKIRESGGEQRVSQSELILSQFYKNPLGNGFVTLAILRNDIKSFQYEVLITAILMRFGIITFLVICISILTNFSYLLIRRRLINKNKRDFLLLGFMAIILLSFTNPYLESFCFQWMFIGPIVLMKEKTVYFV